MSSSIILQETNKAVETSLPKFSLLHDPIVLIILNLLSIKKKATLVQIQKILALENIAQINFLFAQLIFNNLITKDGKYYALNSQVSALLKYNSFSLFFLVGKFLNKTNGITNSLSHEYEVIKVIGSGSTSTTFLVRNLKTHSKQALKIFLPNLLNFKDLDEALKKLSVLESNRAFPRVIDSGEIFLLDGKKTQTNLPCVVLDYIPESAKTFQQFLNQSENVSSQVFEEFIKTIGSALALLESVGLNHGDLHEGNILVTTGSSSNVIRDMYLIDYIGVPSFLSPNLKVKSDLENFRDHLINAALEMSKKNPKTPVKNLIGTKVFDIFQKLKSGKYHSFQELMREYENPPKSVPQDYFNKPSAEPFEWLRVESIPSEELLFQLFEPIDTKLKVIARFGNTWISGPRGCGKSHYLRILAFYPKVIRSSNTNSELKNKLEEINYCPLKNFGVLFACRLGEFKFYDPEAIGKTIFDPNTRLFLKHILILKIWNKTLERIREGLFTPDNESLGPIISRPSNLSNLKAFVEEKIGQISLIEDHDISNIFNQIFQLCMTRETYATSIWHRSELWSNMYLLNERDLDTFFVVLKNCFHELQDTRFYILVDDASEGHIHFEMQKILNSLILAAQSNHCFKITFDKYLYTLDTAEGRGIDPRNDVTYEDLGEGTISTQRGAKESSVYMARVINRRLKYANIKSNIEDILGPSQSVIEFLSALSQPRKSTIKKKRTKARAYYGGWNMIASIAHGSMRTLLEIIEAIFKENNFHSEKEKISLSQQDKSVRKYSVRQFKALAMLPGVLKEQPIGQKLQQVISVIGNISADYLKRYDTKESNRWYETISISRLDQKKLTVYTNDIMIELIKYGLLIVEGTTFSRSQFGLSQRYDMNKIFAPTFQTTYRVRNLMYVSRDNLELLLETPDAFLKKHRNKLESLLRLNQNVVQEELFNEA